ncbi:secretoglobin family 1D member 2-like [Podarcis lilfordi]|uniref:Uteroglobin n=1 Tax=Podarcis lilfordi TaxID=74358 RepID=A0AA35NWJ4_9SAUR|nr:secretoglobin family 1D member 2-like [Podarcis lilfordi]
MKLTTVFLLGTLLVCCYSATAMKTCPVLVDTLTNFLFASHDDYMKAIDRFATTEEMKKAASVLKQCAVGLPESVLIAKSQVLLNILHECEKPQLLQN